MLILYLSDQLFEEILGSDHPAKPSILVNDKCQVNMPALHLFQQVVNLFPFRDIQRRPQYRLDIK